jgi:hypothetical protein
MINEDNINEIFDKEYDEKIEASLVEIWETAEEKMQTELTKIEEEMEKFLDSIADEKFKRSLEINNKYETELRSMEADVDLSKIKLICV